MRVRLDLAYDGRQFAGWAPQPGQRTVCGELATVTQTDLQTFIGIEGTFAADRSQYLEAELEDE